MSVLVKMERKLIIFHQLSLGRKFHNLTINPSLSEHNTNPPQTYKTACPMKPQVGLRPKGEVKGTIRAVSVKAKPRPDSSFEIRYLATW